MTFKRTACALGAMAACAAAHAQESAVPAEPQLQVLVTGSRIARPDAQANGPMITLTREDIQFAAPASLGELVQALPAAGVSLNANGTQGTAFGVNAINLRYLGSAEGSGNRTLVLVDGRRWINAVGGRGFRDFVDLNTIPLAIVDSIEVLKDGASAIYGADAIAGVVNVRTRRRVDGLEASVRLGSTSRGDNEHVNATLNWGRRAGPAALLLSASFSDSQAIRTEDRALTRVALAPLSAPGNSPRGLYTLPGLSNNAYFGTPAGFAQNAANAITRNEGGVAPGASAAADDSFHVAALPADFYNQQTQGLYATGPSRTAGLFGRLRYDLGETSSALLEVVHATRRSAQLFAPFLLDLRGSNGYSISRDQAFNPFGTANGVPLNEALAFAGPGFRLQRVPVEVGNRENAQRVAMSRIVLGLQGGIDWLGHWQVDSAFTYSRNQASFDQRNQINFDHVLQALASPASCAAVAGCTPLDLFGPMTPAMAGFIRYRGRDRNSASQADFTLNATRDLAALQGGALAIALGYEARREAAHDMPDVFAGSDSAVLPRVGGLAQAPTSAPGRSPTSGSYHLQEVYVEMNAPLVAGRPGVHRLAIDFATRYSDYSTVGGKATSKLGLQYAPSKSLLLRSTVSQGFRAPSILELYQGRRLTDFPTIDPCNGGGNGLPGCAGVPSSYQQSQFRGGLTPGVVAGNPQLKPESATTYAVGASVTPVHWPGLSLTVDKFRIKVSDAITTQSATQLLQSCARTGAFCALVRRGSAGEVLELTQAVVNLARIEVEGIDATLRHVLPLAGARIETMLDVAYLQSFKSFVPQPDGSISVDERAGKSDLPRSTFPHFKAQMSLRYLGPAYTAGWKGRYIGHSADLPNNAINGGRLPAMLVHDVQASCQLSGGKTTLAIGIDNLADRQPPASAANNPINFDIYSYDVRGRYAYLRASTKF